MYEITVQATLNSNVRVNDADETGGDLLVLFSYTYFSSNHWHGAGTGF